MTGQTYVKDPSARKDYGFNWVDWLASDTISASAWTITPTGLTSHAESNTTTTATIWLTGGSAGQEYTVTNQITTAGGRIEQLSHKIIVREQ